VINEQDVRALRALPKAVERIQRLEVELAAEKTAREDLERRLAALEKPAGK
jgi:predicted RNase H-like nuclease (RuvC/YqgF family)